MHLNTSEMHLWHGNCREEVWSEWGHSQNTQCWRGCLDLLGLPLSGAEQWLALLRNPGFGVASVELARPPAGVLLSGAVRSEAGFCQYCNDKSIIVFNELKQCFTSNKCHRLNLNLMNNLWWQRSDLIGKLWLAHRFSACSAVKHHISSLRFRGASHEAVEGQRFLTLQNGSLQIIGAEKEDSGKYVCVALNTEGKSAVTAVLDVKGTWAWWTSALITAHVR